jgi:hypothetical protein
MSAPGGYDGPAEVLTADGPVEVTVTVRGAFQPIDGRFHWYGRIAATEDLPADLFGRPVLLRTSYGEVAGRLSDLDHWGRHRISGVGKPPFDMELT